MESVIGKQNSAKKDNFKKPTEINESSDRDLARKNQHINEETCAAVSKLRLIFSPENAELLNSDRSKQSESILNSVKCSQKNKTTFLSGKTDLKAKTRALKQNAPTLKNINKDRRAVATLISQAEKCKLVIRRSPRLTSTPFKKKSLNQSLDLSEVGDEGFFTPLDQSFSSLNQSDCEKSTNRQKHQKVYKQPSVDNLFKAMSDNHSATNPSSSIVEEMEIQAEDINAENPKTMSVQQVMIMFNKMKQDMESVKSQINPEELKQTCVQHVMEQMESTIKTQEDKIKKLQLEVGHFRYKSKVLTEVVQRMHVDSEDLVQKMENLEITATKRHAMITGFHGPSDKDACIEAVKTLFFTYLSVDVNIDDMYPLGAPGSYVIIFATLADKRVVLQFKNQLKNAGDQRNNIYVNEYYPLLTSEKKRRERDIIKENNNAETPLEIGFKSGNLMVQNQTYVKRVSTPTPEELIDIDLEQLDKVLKMKLEKGEYIIEQKSRFIAFTAPVSSFQDIREYYIKMKLAYPHARHIVCSYSLPSDEWYNHNDYCDDGEPGAGRYILRILQQNSLQGRVVFVNRYYGGVKMGTDRFACYANATLSVLEKSGLIPQGLQRYELRNKRQVEMNDPLPQTYQQLQNSQPSQQQAAPNDPVTHRGRRGNYNPTRSLSNIRGNMYKHYNVRGGYRGRQIANTRRGFRGQGRNRGRYNSPYRGARPNTTRGAHRANDSPSPRQYTGDKSSLSPTTLKEKYFPQGENWADEQFVFSRPTTVIGSDVD